MCSQPVQASIVGLQALNAHDVIRCRRSQSLEHSAGSLIDDETVQCGYFVENGNGLDVYHRVEATVETRIVFHSAQKGFYQALLMALFGSVCRYWDGTSWRGGMVHVAGKGNRCWNPKSWLSCCCQKELWVPNGLRRWGWSPNWILR